METFLMFFLGPFIGYFFDSYGPRYILLTGTCFHVFGLMMASLATDYYQIMLSQGICSAAGASMCFYPGMYLHSQSLAEDTDHIGSNECDAHLVL